MSKQNKKIMRSGRGLGSAELAIGSLVIVLGSAVTLNIVTVVMGDSLLDRAARDAARAAAGQPNPLSAYYAAKASLAGHVTDAVIVGQPTLASTTAPGSGVDPYTSDPNFVYQDYGGDPTKTPPAFAPAYVTVTSRSVIKLPCPIQFFGVPFNTKSTYTSKNGYIDMVKTYTFPIINLTLSSSYQ